MIFFLKKLENILNSLPVYTVNLIIAGNFNVNFMTDSTNRNHLTCLLTTYNLEYIVTFPTRVVTQSVSAIDNIFLDRSKYDKFITEPSYNPYPTAFPYGNGMLLHFYQQQESSTTKTVHKVINKGLKAYV